jgi:hypothetical protein
VQVGKQVSLAAGGPFSDSVEAPLSGTVYYKVIIDNDSDAPVTIISLLDDVYGSIIVCGGTNFGGDAFTNVLGQTLAPDDGDGSTTAQDGPDAVVCIFNGVAPSTPNKQKTNTITATVQDASGKKGTDFDTATVTTAP